MQKINLKVNKDIAFTGVIIGSYFDILEIGIDRDILSQFPDTLYLGQRFVIGDIFPQIYKISSINEYPTTNNELKDNAIIEMQLKANNNEIPSKKEIESGIAENYKEDKTIKHNNLSIRLNQKSIVELEKLEKDIIQKLQNSETK